MRCADYRAGDGTKACIHYANPGLCSVPWRVRCFPWLLRHNSETTFEELTTHPEFWTFDGKPLRVMNSAGVVVTLTSKNFNKVMSDGSMYRNLVGDLASFSQCSSMAACPRKWWLDKMKHVHTRETPQYFVIGTAGHEAVQAILKGKSAKDALGGIYDIDVKDVSDPEAMPARLAGIKGVIAGWAKVRGGFARPDPASVETEVHVSHPLLCLHGYLDVLVDEQTVWDLKFVGYGSSEHNPAYEAQLRLYMSMVPTVKRAVLVSFFKPDLRTKAHRIGPGEQPDDVAKRVFKSVVSNPSSWIDCKVYERDPVVDNEFVGSIAAYAARIAEAKQRPFALDKIPQNFSNCIVGWRRCEYVDVCRACGRIDTSKFKVEVTGRDLAKREDVGE